MGAAMRRLPRGGKTIFEVISVGQWIHLHLIQTMKGVMNSVFLTVLPKHKHLEYYELMLKVVQGYEMLLAAPEFSKGVFSRQSMVFGDWVEKDLVKSLYLRVQVITSNPIWTHLTLKERVQLIAECVTETMLWMGAHRASKWKNRPLPEETALSFLDAQGVAHEFQIQTIPLIFRMGYDPEEDG